MPAGHISLRYSSGRSCLGGREACAKLGELERLSMRLEGRGLDVL